MSFFKSTPYYGLINSLGQTGNIFVSNSYGGASLISVSYNFRNNYFFLGFSFRFFNLAYRCQYQEKILISTSMNGQDVFEKVTVDESKRNFITNYLIPIQYGYAFKTKKNVIFIPYVGWVNEFRNTFRKGLYLSRYSGYIDFGLKLKYKLRPLQGKKVKNNYVII